MTRIRLSFWIVFIGVAIIAGLYLWSMGVPQKVKKNVGLLSHPNAAVASEAWVELRELYMTRKAAEMMLISHDSMDIDRPISFLIEIVKFPVPGKEAQDNFWAEGRPIYYKADRVYCRTVGDAIKAILYNERRWQTDYQGDWNQWWEENKAVYESFL